MTNSITSPSCAGAALRGPRARIVRVLFILASALLVILAGRESAQAQSVSTPPWYASNSGNGFSITKRVSDSAVCTGANFFYQITFAIPPGATNVLISDQLPSGLQYVSSSFVAINASTGATAIPATGYPQTPTQYQSGLYSLKFSVAPGGITGSININVRFAPGITCNGTAVRNDACMSYTFNGKDSSLCTPYVSTIAQAHSSWRVTKSVTSPSAWQGGSCPLAIYDSVVTYNVCVSKDPGIECQLNLMNGRLIDLLPPHAVLVTQPAGASTSVSSSGTLLQWPVLPNYLTVNAYNQVCFSYQVLFPRQYFPMGTTIRNGVELDANVGGDSTHKSCDSIKVKDSVCTEIKRIINGNISKWVTTNGQRGCSGIYYLRVCNTGNQPLTNISVLDTLPAGLTYGTPTPAPPTGWTESPSTLTPGSTFVLLSGSSSLAPGSCVTIQIPFTINANAPLGPINNCAVYGATGDQSKTICCTFTVVNPTPIMCVRKEVCAQQASYCPGQEFTYRLRVQNIGGAALTGATITDALDPNLSYVGPVTAYTDNSYSVQCGKATDSWGGGVGTTLPSAQNNNTITFSLPAIPGACGAPVYCGQNGSGVPFYFIEFKVKISDSSSLGSVCNTFTLHDSLLAAPVTSNNVCVSVSALTAFWLEKLVKPSASSTFAHSANVSPGGSVDYLLRLNIPTNMCLAPLRHVSFIDFLPLDNSSSDYRILSPCGTLRGSQFNLTYHGPLSNSLPFASSWVPAMLSGHFNVNAWQPTGAPAGLFLSGCGNTQQWSAGSIQQNTHNFGYYFGPGAYIAGSPAWVEFSATAGTPAAQESTACNSFAAGAAVRWINPSWHPDFPIAGTESPNTCIAMVTDTCVRDHCTDFNDTTGAPGDSARFAGWTTSNLTMTVVHDPSVSSATDYYLHLLDQPNASRVIASATYRGNWLCFDTAHCHRWLCYDEKIFDDGVATSADYAMSVEFYGADGSVATYTAPGEVMSEPAGNHPGWRHVCVPIAPAMPPGWTVSSGTWSGLIHNVANIKWGFDTNPLANEQWGLDNVCVVDSCDSTGPCTPRCDSLEVQNFDWGMLQQSGRTYTILNRAIPASPICSVHITHTPAFPAGGQFTGGGLRVDGATPYPWNAVGSNFYTDIPLQTSVTSNAPPANSYVRFNLGIDSTFHWQGTLTFTIIHCKGDTCVLT